MAPEYECPRCGVVYTKVRPADKKQDDGIMAEFYSSKGHKKKLSRKQDDLIKELSLLIRSRYGLVMLKNHGRGTGRELAQISRRLNEYALFHLDSHKRPAEK